MDQNILLSKIVANPTDSTWAQAYSTLNFYIVLSIKSETLEDDIVTRGKELLEKIQREYFSLDEKTLTNIKKSIENSIEDIDKKTVSIVLATIHKGTLLILITHAGEVILKRGKKIASIARGEPETISAFSGEVHPDDIIILETDDFARKIPVSKLAEVLDNLDVSEISESLAPQVHEDARGTEAAIVLQYKSMESVGMEEAAKTPTEPDESIEELGHKEKISKIKIPNIKIPYIHFNVSSLGRKKITIIAITILIVVLIGSVFFERGRQESRRRAKEFSEILTPAQKQYDEAEALISLNKGLAYEEFDSLKTSLEGSRAKFPEGSSERKKLDEFIGKVESKIGELGAGATIANQKTIIENVGFVSFREGLVATDEDGKIYVLSKDGKVGKEIDSENGNVKSIISDERFVYILGNNGITRTTKSAGTTTSIISDPESTIVIDSFGSNIYGLNTKDKTVDKYVGEDRSNYFVEDITLNDPKSMSIDASVWIIDGKKIRKFTKGREDSFSNQGLTGELGNEAQIFTAPGYLRIYILDRENARIVSIKKDGQFEKNYQWREFSAATSFSVDEDGETIYVVVNNKLYSFDL